MDYLEDQIDIWNQTAKYKNQFYLLNLSLAGELKFEDLHNTARGIKHFLADVVPISWNSNYTFICCNENKGPSLVH